MIENSVAQDTDDALPYLSCVNEATLKIETATLTIADPTTCPLLYTNLANNPPPTCSSNNYANSNVTRILNTL
jgi:hypothetical protein